MLAEIYILKLEAAVRAVKEAATMCPRTGPRAAAPSVTMSTETLARRAHGNCPNPVTSLLRCTAILARAHHLYESPLALR